MGVTHSDTAEAQSDEQFRQEQIQGLQQVPNVGETLATNLIDQFGSIYGVSSWSCHGWGALTVVRGMSKERAKGFFHELKDAGIYLSIHDDAMTMQQLHARKRADEQNDNSATY